MNVSIDLQGWAELEAAWQKAPEIVREELTSAMDEATSLLEGEAKDLTPVGAMGLLRQSILAQEPRVLADQVIGVVGTALDYAVPVELGTKPHFPPVEALEDWVRRRLGVAEKDARRVAFLVARKIAAHGTPAFGMLHRAFAKAGVSIGMIFARARDRIASRLASQGAG